MKKIMICMAFFGMLIGNGHAAAPVAPLTPEEDNEMYQLNLACIHCNLDMYTRFEDLMNNIINVLNKVANINKKAGYFSHLWGQNNITKINGDNSGMSVAEFKNNLISLGFKYIRGVCKLATFKRLQELLEEKIKDLSELNNFVQQTNKEALKQAINADNSTNPTQIKTTIDEFFQSTLVQEKRKALLIQEKKILSEKYIMTGRDYLKRLNQFRKEQRKR